MCVEYAISLGLLIPPLINMDDASKSAYYGVPTAITLYGSSAINVL